MNLPCSKNLAAAPDYPGVMPVRTALRPGVVSPTLPVPKSIERPEYVGKATAKEGTEPWVQTPEVIDEDAGGGPDRRRAHSPRRVRPSRRASPPMSSTGSPTSTWSTTARTRRRWATRAIRSPAAHR